MKLDFTGIKSTNWFYVSAILFVLSTPFSSAFISISAGLLLFSALISFKWGNWKENLSSQKDYLVIFGVYLVYVLGLLFTEDWKWASYDLRKNMAYVIVPAAFIFGPALRRKQVKQLLYIFAGAVVLSSLITFLSYYFSNEKNILNAQEYGFMHHIRFSLQINFAIFILIHYLYFNYKRLKTWAVCGLFIVIIELLLFLIWHQSLTGILTFAAGSFVATIWWITQLGNRKLQLALGLLLSAIVILPALYLYWAIDRYYNVDEWNPAKLEKFSAQDNPYTHNLKQRSVENGHYVWLYICEKEMREEWNKVSDLKYDEKDNNGYKVRDTLIRYLTSKNLRKDAQGIKSLSESDIENIQNGISNYILVNRGISLYPRIYVSIWEMDTYFQTGEANHKSLAQRMEYTKAAIEIIKNNFWIGVGTGNWKKAYRDVYVNNKVKMAEARYGNVHNQYLNYVVKFGILGFLLIMFSLMYPVFKTGTYKNELFFIFLVIMMVGNLGDANFETHTGSHFFIFFYCLFLFPKKASSKVVPTL